MSLKTVANYLSLTLEMQKSAILSAMEYRISFIMQVIGMMINNTGFVLIWLIYFARFPGLNGWTFREMALLLSIGAINYALVWIFAFGVVNLSQLIAKGEIDRFLTLPKNTLWQIAVSKTQISAIGDLLFGFIMIWISGYVSLQNIMLIFITSILSAIIIFSFLVGTQSLAFFLGDFEGTGRELINTFLGFTMYPQGIYSGTLKFLMMTLIPAFFAAALPIQIIRFHDFRAIFYLACASIVFLIVANFIFKKGLKKYESGNFINLNV